MKFRNTTTAQKNLAALMKKAVKESERSDSAAIAAIIGRSQATVISYMNGEIRDTNTGSVILTELLNLIAERENKIQKLVA